jgi:hypothetical protein
MELALKLRVTLKFLSTVRKVQCFHFSTPDILAILKWVGDTIPTTSGVKVQQSEHKPRIVSATTLLRATLQFAGQGDGTLLKIYRLHFCLPLAIENEYSENA